MADTTWAGSQREFARLREAVLHNCTCAAPDDKNPNPPKCGACRMLTDQTTLNHMDCYRRMRMQLRRKEFSSLAEGW